jgi:hypothetical protein
MDQLEDLKATGKKISEGQETGAIARKRPSKNLRGVVDRIHKKKKKNVFVVENNLLNHFIHFQLQNNAPYALKLHPK